MTWAEKLTLMMCSGACHALSAAAGEQCVTRQLMCEGTCLGPGSMRHTDLTLTSQPDCATVPVPKTVGELAGHLLRHSCWQLDAISGYYPLLSAATTRS